MTTTTYEIYSVCIELYVAFLGSGDYLKKVLNRASTFLFFFFFVVLLLRKEVRRSGGYDKCSVLMGRSARRFITCYRFLFCLTRFASLAAAGGELHGQVRVYVFYFASVLASVIPDEVRASKPSCSLFEAPLSTCFE